MHTTTIDFERTEDTQTFGFNLPGADPLVLDFTGIPAEERGGTAKKLLAASAMSCFCAALGGALTARGAGLGAIRGTASAQTGPDASGRVRVLALRLDIEVEIPEDDEAILERCLKLLKTGCLVTASLEPGISVEHHVRPVFTD